MHLKLKSLDDLNHHELFQARHHLCWHLFQTLSCINFDTLSARLTFLLS